MHVSLQKGFNVSLSGLVPGLNKIAIGLGWDVQQKRGAEFDLDASAFVLKADGNVLSDKYFIFFNNKKSPDGVVVHQGDNLTGAGSGDDEVIFVDLNRMKTEALRIVFVVTIYQAEARKQDFGQVDNAFIRIVNRDTNQELARYDLGKEFSHETSMLFGDVYREGNEWHFRAVGEGYKGGLGEAARNFGVNVK